MDGPTLTDAPTFCFLRDQTRLSDTAYQNALHCRDWARSLVENREAYIRSNNLDVDIHLPQGNWDVGRGQFGAYLVVRDGGYEVCNNLRIFSAIFTGWQLSAMASSSGQPIHQSLPPNIDAALAQCAPHPDIHVREYRRITSDLADAMHITPPPAFGEVGWIVDGKIVNHDTFVYLERLVLLAESGKLGELRETKQPCVLEIGGGFGGLAYHVKKIVPQARYYIVDLPESLIFSSIYLTTLFPGEDNVLITPDNLADLKKVSPGFTFIPHYLFDQCRAAGLSIDLAINTLSMSEMAEKQVRYYCEGLKALLGQHGGFFEQNQDNRGLGFLDAKSHIGDHFPHCLPIESPLVFMTQGKAHLWTNTPYRPSQGGWQWRKPPIATAKNHPLHFLWNSWHALTRRLRKSA